MKRALLLICTSSLLFLYQAKAQTIAELKTALGTSGQKVQAIHHYPKNIKDGQCHNVEVTAISLNGDMLTVTETWKNWTGARANTTLTGKVTGNTLSGGEWHSNYSSGNWSYDFSKGSGQWNKTKSMFDGFSNWQMIELRIVAAGNIKDGFFDCK